MSRRNVGIYIYDQAEVLDFAGPFEVFSTAARLCGPETPFKHWEDIDDLRRSFPEFASMVRGGGSMRAGLSPPAASRRGSI